MILLLWVSRHLSGRPSDVDAIGNVSHLFKDRKENSEAQG
jgi:hypothetical protein